MFLVSRITFVERLAIYEIPIQYFLNRFVFILINHDVGKNKKGPTTAEYIDVQMRIDEMFFPESSILREVRKYARDPAKSPVINMAMA